MKLRPERIEFLAQEILKILHAEDFITIEDNPAALNEIIDSITEDLKVEDDLDEEVRQILEEHMEKINQDRIQYHQMFKMVKDKLAKERNLIL